jgi:hypothetical protein
MTFTNMLSIALARVVAFLPNLFAAALILLVGLVIASILARITRRVLQSADLPRRRFAHRLIENERLLAHLPVTLGRVVFWPLALITIGLAIDALNLSWLSAGMARVLEYLPNVLAAAVILIGAYLLANFLSRRASAVRPGYPAPRFWPEILRIGVYVVAGFMALQQLGIATRIVTSAFIIGLGGLVLAASIAFGLGNRELAGRIMRDWYERRRGEVEETRGPTIEPPPVTTH